MDIGNKFLFEKPISEVIKNRISIRKYSAKKLSPELKDKLSEYLLNLTGPFKVNTRFKLVDRDLLRKESDVKIGTYGIISGATSFIAAAVDKADNNLEELGYSLEKVILYATSLELGTCWLGGTFKKGEFAKAIALSEDEVLPVVTPIGYKSASISLIGSFMRFAAGSKNRKGWEELFFNGSFSNSLRETDAGKYAVPLEMVRLAPSASNKQPWRIIMYNNEFHFYMQSAKGYAKALGYNIQRIDMGIAMCHFELTAKEMGINGVWKIQNPGIRGVTEYLVSWLEQ